MDVFMTDMTTYEARKHSYTRTELEDADVELLAQDGFYYCGSEKRIKCFCCELELNGWGSVHGVIECHRTSLSTNCHHAITRSGVQETGDITPNRHENTVQGIVSFHEREDDPFTRGQAKHPDLVTTSQRIKTFVHWQSNTVEPIDLAGAGFFYTGHEDQVRCFYCDGVLSNWTHRGDPGTEHLRCYPTCHFAQVNLNTSKTLSNNGVSTGENFGHTVQNTPLERFRDGQHQTTNGCVENEENAADSPLNMLKVKKLNEAKEMVKFRREKEESQKRLAEVQCEIDNLKSNNKCKICLDRDQNTAFVPCGHICTCNECAGRIRKCCVCRKTIQRTLLVFFS